MMINKNSNFKSDKIYAIKKLLDHFVTVINEDDFDTYTSFMKQNAEDNFSFICQIVEANHSEPRKVTINGSIESTINLLSTLSDSIPDKLFYVNNISVDENDNGLVAIGDIQLSGTVLFQILLKETNIVIKNICDDKEENKRSEKNKNVTDRVFKESIITNCDKITTQTKTTTTTTNRISIAAEATVENNNNNDVENNMNNIKRARLSNGWINLSKIFAASEILTLNCGNDNKPWIFEAGNYISKNKEISTQIDYSGTVKLFFNNDDKIYKFEINLQ